MFRNFGLFLLPLDFVVSSVERWGMLSGGEGKRQITLPLPLPSRVGVVCIFIAAEDLI